MAEMNLRKSAIPAMSRRRMLRAGAGVALLAAGGSTIGDSARAEENRAGLSDPLVAIAMPKLVLAREGIAALADTRLWFWDTGGSGDPVVLLHPASGSGLIWGYQQPVFANAGYRVIGYSRRGYYNSQPIERARPGIGSEDLRQLVDRIGIGNFHLVASAAGGSIASDFAFSHPQKLLSLTVSSNQFGVTDGEILAAAMRIRPRLWDEMAVEFRELGPSYRAINPEGSRAWVELERKSQVGDGSRQSLANRIPEAKLAELKVPTLIICGAADLATPPSIARMLAAKIRNSELVVAPEAGHSVYWEQPELFNRAVLAFIGKHKA
jgi:pimeloyl-ACP methyl ester carboxylesterase